MYKRQIDNILEMAELKKEGKLKKIIVTGCMAQRYKDDVLHEPVSYTHLDVYKRQIRSLPARRSRF